MSVDSYPDSQDIVHDDYGKFIHEHTPVDIDAYMEQKVTEIASGIPTWIVRNFTSDSRVYDLFINKQCVGFIDQENQITEAYVIEEDGQPALDISFETESLQDNLMAAKRYLEGVTDIYNTN